MKHSFRTRSACRIAMLDRDRFNEAVAAGNYPCAPEVRRGATRVFDEDDLAVLFIYGRLLEQDFTPKLAGHLACKVCDCLKYDASDEEEEILLLRTMKGAHEVWAGSKVKETPRTTPNGDVVLFRLSFDIANVREIVRRESAEEIAVVGTDDEGDQ